MASSQMVLCKEHLQCSICEEDFLNPVSLPCAHKFCKVCIEVHWDMKHVCECPRCKQTFPKRPDLHIDRNFAEITEQFKRRKLSSPEECSSKPGDVPCDVCTGRKLGAVKSCLVCLASYCETHIQPHYQAAAFKRHRLIDPVDKLEDKLCQKHEKLLELFCRTDQTCVCQFCTETDHRTHSTVTLEEECRDRKAQVLKTKAEVQQMIQERLGKVEEIKYSLELSTVSPAGVLLSSSVWGITGL
uniref:B box-type domain-containing protein n=1 Tax=Lepisosteus oculatus TaxID=7918 RepID=W5M5X6_LEPOC